MKTVEEVFAEALTEGDAVFADELAAAVLGGSNLDRSLRRFAERLADLNFEGARRLAVLAQIDFLLERSEDV